MSLENNFDWMVSICIGTWSCMEVFLCRYIHNDVSEVVARIEYLFQEISFSIAAMFLG